MIRVVLVLLLALGLLSLSTCERKANDILPADPSKVSGEWKLVEPATAYEITLRLAIDPAAQTIAGALPYRVAGRSAVNQYFALATFGKTTENGSSRDDGASFGAVGATKMAGPPEAMQVEADYFRNLQAVYRFELTSRHRLRLHYRGEQPGVLIYEKKE